MSTSNNFIEYYKTISHTDLLRILENPEQYQSLAVEAAKAEFANRHLSDSEIQEARQPLISKQAQKEKEKQKVKAVEKKISNIGERFIETINPIQREVASAEKTIRWITLIFAFIFFYMIVIDFRLMALMLKDIENFDSSSFFYFFPFIIIPVATIFFWKRKKAGWIGLAFFTMNSASEIFWNFMKGLIGNDPYNFNGFEVILPKASPSQYIIQLLVFGGILHALCKPDIRSVFKIQHPTLIITLALGGLLTILLRSGFF